MSRIGSTFCLLLLLGGVLPLTAAAQQKTVRGRVYAGSQPVPNQLVSLHRVTSTGGTTLSTDTTSADGSFELSFEPGAGEAIFFAATRYDDQLYIGETFREPTESEYRLAVGPGATPVDLGASQRTPAPPPVDRSARKAGIIVIAVSTLLLGAIVLVAARPRAANTRRLLVEIADLDNRHADAAVTNYQLLRSELLRRLRESA